MSFTPILAVAALLAVPRTRHAAAATAPVLACVLWLGLVSTAQAAPGDLDRSFANAGTQITDFGGSDVGEAVAVQDDDKIVVAGTRSGDFAVARYNPDGSLDTGFSIDGKETTDFGGGFDRALAVVVEDGKIVVAGAAGEDFGLARYNADGSLDTSFSDDGRQVTDFGFPEFGGTIDEAAAVAVQPDGKIVAAGHAMSGADDFAVARYNPDGSLDASFSDDGKQTTDFGPDDAAAGVAVQADSKIVAVGRSGSDFWGGFDFALARYTAEGSLDTSFGASGVLVTDFGGDDAASAVALQTDGKIVAAGYALGGAYDFGLARYNADGSLDAGFSVDGKQTTHFNGNDGAAGIALQPDGKIVTAGYGGVGAWPGDFAVARHNADGSLDAGFSADGKQMTDFGWDDAANDVALERDGDIVAAGLTGPIDGGRDFAVARYQGGEGTSDTDAPETTITGGASGITNNSIPAFSFGSSEAGSTFECRVDGGAFAACSSPHTVSPLGDGPHTFEVRATDGAGNTDLSPASRSFTIDTAAPETTITGGPSGTTTDRTATFTFNSSEASSAFECRIDGAAFSQCSSPHTTASLGEGAHTFEVRATDAAGNTDPTLASQSWTIVLDYRAEVLGIPGLVSYWRLGETSGTTAGDASGANNGRYRHGVALGRPSALLHDANPSAGFDGSNDYADVADHASLDSGDSFTLEAWVKRSGTSSSTETVLSKGSGSWRLSFVNNALTLAKAGSGTVATASVSTTDTTGFHHVVAAKSGATVKLYIDGVDRTGSVTNRTIANTSTALNIGRYTAGAEYFPGLVDEVAIYNVALTEAQVQRHFKASGR